jgi:pyruvate,water dikinase
MEQHRGRVDEPLLGRLQNSATDRNWDSIEALWHMKNEVRDDAELRSAFAAEEIEEIVRALRAGERGRRFIAERVEPYQREFGWHAVWSHEFIFPTVREQMEPVIELVRGYLVADYDFPSAIAAMRLDIEAASHEVLDGLTGDALEEMRAANAVNRRMAPLTPDHHFYIDQGANAHVRLVLIEIGRKLVAAGRLDQPDDVMFLRYNELRALIGSASAIAARETVAARRLEREAAQRLHPRDWVGTVTPSQLAFPYLVNWGYPDRFHQTQSDDQRVITGLGASPGTIEGIARVVRTIDEFDQVREGDILVCQMTNPAWVVLFTKIAGLVTDTGGTTSHPAVLSREFGIPAVVGTSGATRVVATGDRIRVDGSKGVVEILERAAGSNGTPAAPTPAAAIGT